VDAYLMGALAVDEAVRNALAVVPTLEKKIFFLL